MSNDVTDFGRTFKCVSDMDDQFSTIKGVEVAVQAAIHRLTVNEVLGDDGTGSLVVAFGYDCRQLLGMRVEELATMPPVLSEAMQRDPRIESADVRLIPLTRNGQLHDVELSVNGETALGPFSFVKKVTELTASDLVGQQP